MAAQQIAAGGPPANPPIITTLILARNVCVVVGTDTVSGLVLIHAGGDRHTDASLQPEAELEPAWRIVGRVAQSFRPRS
jgi:hypothetical protein